MNDLNKYHSLAFHSESWHAPLNKCLIKQTEILENLDLGTSYELPREAESKKTCFNLRSKVNMYCADGGFWSDWSQTKCTVKPTLNYRLLDLVMIGTAGVIIFCLSLWILTRICIKPCSKKDVIYTLYKQKVNENMPSIFSPIFK